MAYTPETYTGCAHCGCDLLPEIRGGVERCVECGAEWHEAEWCSECGCRASECECDVCETCGMVDCNCDEIRDRVEAALGLLREFTERDYEPSRHAIRWLEVAGQTLLEAAQAMRDDMTMPRARRLANGESWCTACSGTGAKQTETALGIEWDVCGECDGKGRVPSPVACKVPMPRKEARTA